jgi:membrane protease YdiL (CAAX protease family)
MPATSERSEASRRAAGATARASRGRWESGGPWIALSLVLSFVAAGVLIVALDVPFLDAYLLAALMVLLPGLGVAQTRATGQPGLVVDRIHAYASSALAISALGGLSLIVALQGGGPASPSLASLPAGTFWGVTAALLAAAGLVIALAQVARKSLGLEESPLLAALLPRTSREKRAFAGLSLVAGLGEEMAYRGYAIPALAAIFGGPWVAAVLTSLAFGAVHAYQGALGVVRTAVLGMVLAVPVVLFGSLWPSVVVHIAIDLVGGLWLGPRVVARSSSLGPSRELVGDRTAASHAPAEL